MRQGECLKAERIGELRGVTVDRLHPLAAGRRAQSLDRRYRRLRPPPTSPPPDFEAGGWASGLRPLGSLRRPWRFWMAGTNRLHEFDGCGHRNLTSSALGSRAAPPMQCADSRFDARPPGPRPSSPPLVSSPIRSTDCIRWAQFDAVCNSLDANQTIICRAVGGIGRGSLVVPDRYSSTPAAQARPSAMAQTISD
jgi:hypothetical protein